MNKDYFENALRNRSRDIVRHIANLHFRKRKGERPRCINHADRKAQYHHTNYNEPLQVMRLCGPCHHLWHKNNQVVEITREKSLELIEEYGWGITLSLELERLMGEKKAFYRALNTLIAHESRTDHFFRLLKMRNVELMRDFVAVCG
jgi:hypothetical protein